MEEMEREKSFVLGENGRAAYRIVIAADASPSERHAAEELSRWLWEMSGARLPILTDAECGEEPAVLVGRSERSAPALTGEEWASLGEEGFQICAMGEDLVIAGSRVRGALYGVYGFLERFLGCRWFSPDVRVIPKRRRLAVRISALREVPVLEYREPYVLGNVDPDWHAANRCNGDFSPLASVHGGKMKYRPFVHTFYELVEPERYFAEHPEYFALVDGRRTAERAQLCLTNEDVFQIALRRVREWMAENPEARILSVSQNDCFGPCTCPACRAVDEEEGSHAGTILRFVNRIAEAIEKEHPHLLIDTLAYQYSRKPPRLTRPRENVIVRLCSIECCFAHPLEDCSALASFGGNEQVQQSFTDDLLGWSRICSRLYVWDYVTNFANYLQPFPNFGVLQKNIRFLAAHHVRGIFEEGNNAPGEGGELNRLRQYLLAKLLWNPDADADAAIDEFLTACYGMAAPWMRRWIALMQSRIRPGIHMGIYDKPDAPYLDDFLLDEGDHIFDAAERAAEDEQVLARVRTARLSLRFVRLARAPADATGRAAEIRAFFRDAREAGITQLREWTPLEVTEEEMLRECAASSGGP